jgi:hypothetical protein
MIATAAFSLAAIVAGCLWIKTGVSIFVWISRGALHCEAVRIQAWSSIGWAARHFVESYPGTLAVVKAIEADR